MKNGRLSGLCKAVALGIIIGTLGADTALGQRFVFIGAALMVLGVILEPVKTR